MHRAWLQVQKRSIGRPRLEPAIHGDLAQVIPNRSSSVTVPGSSVSSTGLPSSIDAGRITPCAPLVCSVTSCQLLDEPNPFASQLALADRPAWIEQLHHPVLDRRAAHPLSNTWLAARPTAVCQVLEQSGRLPLRACSAPARLPPQRGRLTGSLLDRALELLAGLDGQLLTSCVATTNRRRLERVPPQLGPPPSYDPGPDPSSP